MVFEFISQIFFFGITATGIIWRIRIKDRGSFIFEYEFLCNFAEAIYYLLQIIIGIFSMCKKNKENFLKNFLKYKIFKLLFPLIMAVPFIYIFGYNLDWFSFEIDSSKNEFWCDLIIHIIAPSCCLFNTILFGKKYSPSNIIDIIIITGIYVAYFILCLHFQTNKVYKFIGYDISFIISVAFIFYVIGIVMHFLYIAITKFLNDSKKKYK